MWGERKETDTPRNIKIWVMWDLGVSEKPSWTFCPVRPLGGISLSHYLTAAAGETLGKKYPAEPCQPKETWEMITNYCFKSLCFQVACYIVKDKQKHKPDFPQQINYKGEQTGRWRGKYMNLMFIQDLR